MIEVSDFDYIVKFIVQMDLVAEKGGILKFKSVLRLKDTSLGVIQFYFTLFVILPRCWYPKYSI